MAEHKDEGVKRSSPTVEAFAQADRLVASNATKVTELKKKRIVMADRIRKTMQAVNAAQDMVQSLSEQKFKAETNVRELTLVLKTLMEYDKSLDREVDERMGFIQESIEETSAMMERSRKRRRT